MVAVKKIFSLAPLVNLSMLSKFQNDGATIECSTLVLLQIQLAILCF